MPEEYPWYEIVDRDEDLQQGDFIKDCPVFHPSDIAIDKDVVDGEIKQYDAVIMSQSCDLAQQIVDLVLVCPIIPFSELEKNDFYKSTKGKKALIDGYVPGYHIFRKCEIKDFERDFFVVDFRNVYGVPYVFLCEWAQKEEKRLRLLPPYRENLSQAFAKFFMRVGLPVGIRIEELQ